MHMAAKDLVSRLAQRLGSMHRCFSVAQHIADLLRVTTAERYTDAHGRVNFLTQETERNCKGLLYPYCYGTSFLFSCYFVEQDCELITTHPPENVALAHAAFYPL